MSIDTTEGGTSMDEKEVQERLHAVEVAQATGTATLAGAQATQAAAQAGSTATMAAMQAGNMATMAAGGVGLIAGIFIGIALRSGR
jgi:hypothetical protein